jgi:HTH-type transcriptional regulator/antitoxin HipB
MSPLVLRVRDLRKAAGMTQAQLAQRAGIRRATVNRIENDRVTAIDLKVLEKIADALEVEPGSIVVRARERKVSVRRSKRTR